MTPGQPEKNHSNRSAAAGRKFESRPLETVLKKSQEIQSSEVEHLCKARIDTIVLIGRIPPGCKGSPVDYTEEVRREPDTGYKRTWYVIDRYQQGWRLSVQPELGWMEVNVFPARLARPAVIHNYPLVSFTEAELWQAEQGISSALQPAREYRNVKLGRLGVRRVAYTADLPIRDKSALFAALKSVRRAGSVIQRDTSSLWKSGSRSLQIYDKQMQSKSRLPRRDYQRLLSRHPELDRVVRFEATLGAKDLRKLFRLPRGRLPQLGLVNQERVAKYVLYEELVKKLKLSRLAPTSEAPQNDELISLMEDLAGAGERAGEPLTFDRACKLAVVLCYAQVYKGPELRRQLGISASYSGKLIAQLRALGFPPGVVVEPKSRRCLRELRKGLLQATAGDRRIGISDETRERFSVIAPWGAVSEEEAAEYVDDEVDSSFDELLSE